MATPTSSGSITILSPSDLTGINYIDSLAAGTKWGGGLGTSVSLTYSFGGSGSVYSTDSITGYGPSNGSGEPWNGWSAFSSTQITATNNALSTWAEVANVTFTQVTDSSTVAGELRFAESNIASPTAFAYYPWASAWAGDVWFSDDPVYDTS